MAKIVSSKSVVICPGRRMFDVEALASLPTGFLLATALRMKVRAFASIGGGGRNRQNPKRERTAKAGH
jgi:hypothetical protein